MKKTIKIEFQKSGSHINCKELFLLLLIFLLSFIIRRIGLKYGFPLLTHPDEGYSLDPVFYMTKNKTLNSETFNRPDQILLFINFIYLNIASYIHFGKSIASTYLENELSFYYYGRLLICFIGSIIPIIAYKIGKEFKLDFSFPAALIFAFFPSYVIHSHYITPDIPITLLSLLVILFAVKYLKTQKLFFLYIATVFVAINTAEKYPGILSLSLIFFAILIQTIRNDQLKIKEKISHLIQIGLKTIGLFVASFYIIAPNIFIEFGKVIQTIQYEARNTHLGADNLGWMGNLVFYIKNFYSFSNFLAILFLLIGIFACWKLKDEKLLLLLYGILYWIIMSKLALHWERWALPMYTSPLFFISLGIAYLYFIFKYFPILNIISLLLIISIVSHQLLYALSASISLSFTDTRVIALDYCREVGIDMENSVYEGYTPFNPQNPGIIFENAIDKKYIILSSYMYGRYYQEPQRYLYEIKFYSDLLKNNRLIKEVAPKHINHNSLMEVLDNMIYYFRIKFKQFPIDRYNGPTIKIYEN